ncbi:bifunctional DNA primase/polymerase [Streptomyces sp. NBC_01187]|uniref:bifunctional DNA primase/polymerase n=1 Tax=Streptomyces sp. NBC_01187 TaxID=2903766 RepID=UPI003865741C|nr:bifunctional DNA primase/polymerase [Streptomyces sp. NBC_01187]
MSPQPRDVASWLADRGWPVHPLAPGRKTPAANCPSCQQRQHAPAQCPCHREGKWCHGFHSATTDPVRIAAWWDQEPRLGVGVSCGPAQLVVLDVDAHPEQAPARDRLLPGIPIAPQVNLKGLASGYDTLALLAAYRRQEVPTGDAGTLRVRTPSGGMHVWYRNPRPALRFRSSTGSSPKTALAWQVDVRAHGGYIIAPGTRTPAGTYTPVGPAREPGPLPRWLADELQRTGHLLQDAGTPSARRPDTHRSDSRRFPRGRGAQTVLTPLLEAVRWCGTVPEGAAFTEKLNRAAYTAGGLTAGGHLDADKARQILLATAHEARPRQARRNESIIDAAFAAGLSRPFHPKDPHE